MPNISLDAAFVRNAACPPGKSKIDYYDTAITGFIVEVRASGGKTYHLRYRDRHGKLRQHKIGDAKSLTFDKARQAAQKLRARVVLGENPAEERNVLRSVPTLSTFTQDRYLPYVKGYKRSWESDESFLRNHVLLAFGSHHLDEITHAEVIAFHHSLRDRGYAPATANRMVVLLRYMFNLARKWKIPGSEQNPAAGVPLFEANNERERYLSATEAERLFTVLRKSQNTQLQYIVPLLLLLGCRKRELLNAKWEEFDRERRLWRIPITKSGKARHVPLSDAVLDILDRVPRWEGCPYVVPNPNTRLPFVSIFHGWDNARREAGMPEVRMHDLRHSFASFLVNAGRSIYEVQKILGHSQLKTTQRYSHLAPETLLNAADAAAQAVGIGGRKA